MGNIDHPSSEPHIIMGLPSNLPENVEKEQVRSYKGKIILGVIIFVLIVIPMLAIIFLPKNIIQASKEIILAPFHIDTGRERYTTWRAASNANPTAAPITSDTQKKLTDAQVLALSDNKYADGNVPLGDSKYVTDRPEKGYVFLCSAHADPNAGGAQAYGSWIQGTTWNYKKKAIVRGSVSWDEALFSNVVSGEKRILAGNDLPINHTTGTFPIATSDPAYAYDRNPNSITAQNFSEEVSASPVYSDNPYCMSGEVGMMLSGVALFNGFDAGLRDAAAHEVQDSCDGHPQKEGKYHYHSMSSCFQDISIKTVLGYALDGFPITGPLVAADKYLTTEDLDVCHGITSDIVVNGKTITSYHYVMTRDFPYSVSCFRGVPAFASGQTAPLEQTQQEPVNDSQPEATSSQQSVENNEQPFMQAPEPEPQPQPEEEQSSEDSWNIWSILFPQAAQTQQSEESLYSSPAHQSTVPIPSKEAVNACEGKNVNDLCSYKHRGNVVEGDCEVDANYFFTCVSGE